MLLNSVAERRQVGSDFPPEQQGKLPVVACWIGRLLNSVGRDKLGSASVHSLFLCAVKTCSKKSAVRTGMECGAVRRILYLRI